MSEGGGRFESYSYRNQAENPQERMRNGLRGEMYRVLEQSGDALSREVAIKVLEKLAIKDRVDDLIYYQNDPTTYQPWKKLGLFVVIDRESAIEYIDQESGFEICKGERVLDIHLPPVSEDKKNKTSIEESMQLLAKYILLHKIDAKYITGITFEKLAKISRHQGFKIVKPAIPENITRGVKNVYRRFVNPEYDEKKLGDIVLLYQETSQFLERYLQR